MQNAVAPGLEKLSLSAGGNVKSNLKFNPEGINPGLQKVVVVLLLVKGQV